MAAPEGPTATPEGGGRGETRPLAKRPKPPAPLEHPRYEDRGIIGRGGQGNVHRVFDRELEREVALKTLRQYRRAEDHVEAFGEEAKAAAGLEHPNIVPIHDVGTLGDGRPFYTMRLVSGETLAHVLFRLQDGRAPEWSTVRLVQAVQQVCRALQHSHEHGILHRDVKPSNILLGPVGEVLLVDWGIFKSSKSTRRSTASGVVKGTACYMSPEQARSGVLDARSDVYAAGVVLYECLTLRLPFDHENTAELLAAILRDPPPHPQDVALGRGVPEDLSRLTLRALAKDPDGRFGSARELHDALQAWMEGAQDAERRRGEADALHLKGDGALERHLEALAEGAAMETEVARLEEQHPPWQAVAEKRPLLEARRRLEDASERAQELFLEAVNRYTDALAHLPDHGPSRRALADVFWARFEAAEREGEVGLAHTYRALVERFHDGRFSRQLAGRGSLELAVRPSQAELFLHRQVERDLVLVDGPARLLGRGDVRLDDLDMGSYVVVARAAGHETTRYPVAIERCGRWRGELRLIPEGTLPEGFVHVPGMVASLGGDREATNGWPRRVVRVASFAMARHPVTFEEYCEFLDALGERADERVPRLDSGEPLAAREGGCHRAFVGRPLPETFVADHGAEAVARLPVFCLSHDDVDAYIAWRSERDGRAYRLPTAEEWEIAARGADQRTYPWGDRFDAALCHGRDSYEHDPEPGPVGAFATDRSAVGVHDMAGCIKERTASYFDPERAMWEVRGGSWQVGPALVRSAWRGACARETRNVQLGFRLALSLEAPT